MEKMLKRLFKLTASLLLVVTSIVYQPTLVMAIDGEPGEITINKTKDFGNDDEYIITLSVQGNPTEETVPAPVDIVLVLDRSGSMSGAKMTALKTAAKNFVDTILDRNSNSRIAIVSFASNITPDPDGFISDRVALKAKITALNASGGTHLEGGIYQGYLMLEANTSTRPKSMVVMGDGEPTYGYDFTGVRSAFNFDFTKRVGSGSSRYFTKGNNTHDLADSVAHIGGWVKAKYDSYSIGLSVNNAGKTVLESVQNKGYWAANSSNLNQIFNLIAQDVTNYHPAGTDAVVTDEIGAEFEFAGFVGTYPGTAVYDNNTRLITWALGNIEATTKVLKYKVVLKADAPAGKEFTNEFADLDYTDPEGVSRKRHFPKPEVIIIRYVAEAGGTVTRAIESMDETQGVAKGSKANPADDYIFVHWTNEAGAVVSTSATYIPPKNSSGKNVPATYTAHFTRAADVTIEYKANEGGSVNRAIETLAPVTGVAQGSTASAASGYEFVNWTTDQAGLNEIGDEEFFKPNQVGGVHVAAIYYANFKKINYEFTFDPNGGLGDNVVRNFTVGGSVTPASFTRPGYDFDRWTLDAAGTQAYSAGFTNLTAGNKYVYAQWIEKAAVLIEYEALVGGTVDRAQETLAPATGTALGSTATASAGYEFDKWTRDAAGLDVVSTDEHFTPAKVDDLNVAGKYYAHFKPLKNTKYTVEYYFRDINETSYTRDDTKTIVDTGTTGTSVTAPAPTFPGFTENASHPDAVISGVITGDGLLVLKRYYNRNQYKITYNIVGSYFAKDAKYVRFFDFDADVSPQPDESEAGYVFNGWSEEPIKMPAENLEVEGSFSLSNETAYQVRHHLKNLGSDSYTEDESNRQFETGTTGEFTAASPLMYLHYHPQLPIIQKEIAANGSTIVDIYYDRNEYTITYLVEANGVIVGTHVQTVEYGGSTTEVTALGNSGYHFELWLEDGNINPFRHEEDVRANATYTARMVEDKNIVINYWANDGGDVSEENESLAPVTGVAEGSEAQEHDGYEFINWTRDEAGLDEVSTDLHFIPDKVEGLNIAADYYANFKAIDYNFTFDPNHDEDDTIIQTFNVGGSVEEVGFSRSGFRFVRWTLDAANEEAYEGGFDELPAQDIYIFAQWEAILPDEYVLTYVSNQPGLDIPNVIFNEGDAITPVMPMVDGFEFLGWFIDEDFSAEFMEFGSMPARNVTVYADWGEVLGDEDEEPVIPVMGDFTSNYAMILLLLGILGVMISKKEESSE